MISFLVTFGAGRELILNLAGHCDPSSGGCQGLAQDIRSCQNKGVKLLMSIGGAAGNYGIESVSDTKQVAQSIWDDYLGGNGTSRPFGNAVLEGVDFDIELGGSQFYADLATELRNLMDSNRERSPSGSFILGSAPQCPFKDARLGPGEGTALGTGFFNMVWVQFYNNPGCQYDFGGQSVDALLASWKQWTDALPTAQIYMGLPASPSAATNTFDLKSGFIPSDVLVSQVLPAIKSTPNYGGIMLWSAFFDQRENAQTFSSTLKESL